LPGWKVARIVNRDMENGYHQVFFLDTNLPPGVYIYRLTSGDFISIKKMMLMKIFFHIIIKNLPGRSNSCPVLFSVNSKLPAEVEQVFMADILKKSST